MTDLYVEEWGTGDRMAVLLHGVTSSSATWWRVGPELAARGYHVYAPDLRGHGRSPRGSYSPEEWAADVLDAVPAEPELAIGLSLGGLVLATAVERLKPSRAVYEDPAWWVDGDRAAAMAGFRASKAQTLEQVRQGAPRWAERSVQAKYDALQEWDPDTVEFVADFDRPTIVAPVVPSLVLAALEWTRFTR